MKINNKRMFNGLFALLVLGVIGFAAYKIRDLNRQYAFFKTRIDWDQYNPDLHGVVLNSSREDLCYYLLKEKDFIQVPAEIDSADEVRYLLSFCDNGLSNEQTSAPMRYTILASYWVRVPFLINGLGNSTRHYVIVKGDQGILAIDTLWSVNELDQSKKLEGFIEWNRDGKFTR